MAERTREQLREEAGKRRVSTGSFAEKQQDLDLEAEAARLRQGEDQDGPTPFEEAAAEAERAGVIIDPKTGQPVGVRQPEPQPQEEGQGLAQRIRERAARLPVSPQARHSAAFAAVIESAYQDFSRRHEPETARALTQAYAVLELGGAINQISKKF